MHRYEKHFTESSANGEYERRETICQHIDKFCQGVIVDSNIGKQQYIEAYGLEESRIFILPFIPPKYIYQYKNSIDSSFKDRYNVPEKYILYPARFWPHKNHSNLLKAIAQLKKEIPDICLVLTGWKDINYFPAIKKLIAELKIVDNVKIYGYVEDADIVQFYKHARAMIMPTYYGPTNIPPLEAIALDCPVAVSRIYGMPDQLQDASLYFDPSDVNEVASVIRQLWNDDSLCETLIKKGRIIIAEHTQDHFNMNLLKIIKTLLDIKL